MIDVLVFQTVPTRPLASRTPVRYHPSTRSLSAPSLPSRASIVSTNDQILLQQLLDELHTDWESTLTPSQFFELFTAEQFLKDYDLSDDQLESGLIGGGQDGGIDGLYLFLNGELLQEDKLTHPPKQNLTLDLCIIQSKSGSGFEESPVERFITVTDNILDLSNDPTTFAHIYNPALITAIQRFRTVHKQLVTRFPLLRICYCYASKAGVTPPTNVVQKTRMLKQTVRRHFPGSDFSFTFLGAAELIALARKAPTRQHSLKLAEIPISSSGQIGFACLVSLGAFYEFITNDNHELRRQIFEANVRDYQGPTEVNAEIQESLQESHSEDFWWLNNGISIVATKASLGGKTLTIEDPAIVNGLQTSMEIYSYFKHGNSDSDDRHLLVRVIVPEDDGSRYRIIKATNRQTAVQLASLRSTDKIHRDIEQFLAARNLYYDRRKNFYKNEGKPRERIIGIPYLAQSVMAILLRRPDTARARPSSLLKRDDDYEKIYNPSYPLELYYVCVASMKRVENFLRQGVDMPTRDRTNLRFYVGMHAVLSLTESVHSPAPVLATINLDELTDQVIESSLTCVQEAYERLGASDQVAKGPDLRDEVLTHLAATTRPPGKQGKSGS